ncbi:MAG: GNAT family N-acetyltransferase [Eubacteriaceae bacterium]|nr:GNAT family N-acetyltransferase [Eubacteriaceae bacterium]
MEYVVKRYDELTLDELYEILRIRCAVFVVEQDCPYQDIDGKDKGAIHVYLKEEDRILAYLRVLDRGVSFSEVSLGRVISTERLKGYGRMVLQEGIKVARERFSADAIRIEAQVQASGFYEKAGFIREGGVFLEDGIPHIEMILKF